MRSIDVAILSADNSKITSTIPQISDTGLTLHHIHYAMAHNYTQYDVVVVSEELLEHIGGQIIHDIISVFPHAKIMVVCNHINGIQARQWMQIGVSGIVLSEDISNSPYMIHTVAEGRVVISPDIIRSMLVQKKTA